MTTLVLARDRRGYPDQGTFGELFHPEQGVLCYMGELPWRDNRRGVSCIPEGSYKVDFMARSASGKYRNVWHVQNVFSRSGILIHAGNYCGDEALGFKSDTDGCLLPGTSVGVLSGQTSVLGSKGALSVINQATGRESFELIIWDRT